MNNPRSLELLLALFTLITCVAQAEPPPPPSPTPGTGLEGLIMLHSISGGPVRQGVPDARPLTQMAFEVKQVDKIVASFTTDDQGRFRVAVPPGHYTVSRKDWKSRVGFYGPFQVDVPAGQFKAVEWKCDTGMQ